MKRFILMLIVSGVMPAQQPAVPAAASEPALTISQKVAIQSLLEKMQPYVQELNAVIAEVQKQHPDYTFDPTTMRFIAAPKKEPKR